MIHHALITSLILTTCPADPSEELIVQQEACLNTCEVTVSTDSAPLCVDYCSIVATNGFQAETEHCPELFSGSSALTLTENCTNACLATASEVTSTDCVGYCDLVVSEQLCPQELKSPCELNCDFHHRNCILHVPMGCRDLCAVECPTNPRCNPCFGICIAGFTGQCDRAWKTCNDACPPSCNWWEEDCECKVWGCASLSSE